MTQEKIKAKKKRRTPKSILLRVNHVNSLLPAVNQADSIPVSYYGGTWPHTIVLTKPIECNGQYVYITCEDSKGNPKRERYNCRDLEQLGDLKYELRHIKKAFEEVINNSLIKS